MTYFRRPWIVALALSVNMVSAHAAFTINLTFQGLDATQQSYFTEAKSFWESAITGYQTGISLTGFDVLARGTPGDGVGGVLGSAGPDVAVTQAGFLLTTAGSMDFDTADINSLIAQGSFSDVIRHEMGHVIGFGTLWTQNRVYVDGSGHFTGAAALAQYRTEFVGQGAAAYVPIELGGGQGTADGHWNEVDGGGSNTGIVDAQGRDFKNELMTGWLNAPTFTSRTTIASFQDIGYVVNLSAVPEPEAIAMFVVGLPFMLALAARRKRTRDDGLRRAG
jgi:Leishmanolysin